MSSNPNSNQTNTEAESPHLKAPTGGKLIQVGGDSDLVEGGAFNCGIHNFTTPSKKEFDAHCKSSLHVLAESGNAECLYCHKQTGVEGLPHHTQQERPGAICDDCFETYVIPTQERLSAKRNLRKQQAAEQEPKK